jgi:hypothetical protein
VCLSVLNVPATLLDSNYFSIKTLEYQERARLEQVSFANQLIAEEQEKLVKDTARVYLNIQARLHKSYEVLDKFEKSLIKKLASENTDVFKEFNSKRKTEEIFLEDSAIYHIQYELFDLVKFLSSQPYQLDSAIKTLIPVVTLITTRAGKEVEWARYLFLHKPTAISYFHIKRIKLLLLDNENVYQNAALKTIGYLPAYYSEQNNLTVLFKQGAMSKVIDNQKTLHSLLKKVNVPITKPVEIDTTKFDKTDELTKRLHNSLHGENFYVGIQNEVLKEFNFLMGSDFGFDIIPDNQTAINKKGNDYAITFKKPGEYTLRFTDKRNGANKVLFDKKVNAYLLPNPLVRLNSDNISKETVSVRDLLSSNRLVAYLGLSEINIFPGRINGFRIIKISKNGQKSEYNYGEVFQPNSQSLIGSLQVGDIVLFDNVTVSMIDGTTRSAAPLTYKIVE